MLAVRAPMGHHGVTMPYTLEDKLVVGITSRALFDLHAEDELFRTEGLEAYRSHQRAHEGTPLAPGTGFPLVSALLGINERSDDRLVEVVIMSRNDADTGARVLHSAHVNSLDITRAAFTNGNDPWPYLSAFHCNLFLSAERDDVDAAQRSGVPAALVSAPPEGVGDPGEVPRELRIAFDGDAVLFDASSEDVYQQQGLAAFQAREADLVEHPLGPGPFEPFLRALQRIQARFPEDDSPVRTALVTARSAPAHRRVINTLRAWGVRIDESFFMGGVSKAPVLESFSPHIFFDDQVAHLEPASRRTPSAQVLVTGPQQLGLLGDDTPQATPAPPTRAPDAAGTGGQDAEEPDDPSAPAPLREVS
jgi:5'-nucleotidase